MKQLPRRTADTNPLMIKLKAEGFEDFGVLKAPEEAEPPILALAVRGVLQQWLAEQGAAAEMKAVGLTPRLRALLSGPPGCGKTTLAHHLAARLGLPILIVDSTQLLSRYVSASGENIGNMFRKIAKHARELVLFFDEIDSIARKRLSDGQSAAHEQSKIVIALMQQLYLRGECVVFAATNRPDILDEAVWRRFQIRMEIGLPDEDARFAIIKRYLAPFAWQDEAIDALVTTTAGATPALLKDLTEGIKREMVLGPRLKLDTGAAAVIGRILASVKPPPEIAEPPLWAVDAEAREAMLSDLAWPPRRGAAS